MYSFLIKFNRRSGALDIETFEGQEGAREAIVRRLELERSREDQDVEIVAINAPSLDAVRQTHARYFSGSQMPSLV